MPNPPKTPASNSLPAAAIDPRPDFTKWLAKYRSCDKGKTAPELHELAILASRLLDAIGEDIFWKAISLPEDFAQRNLGPSVPSGAQGALEMLKRIRELMPGAVELFERVQADKDLFAHFRRNRCRELANWVLSQPAPNQIVGADVQDLSSGALAKQLRKLEHDEFAAVLQRAGFITPNQPH